jgi:drug/metabolite transporter (DMT)-like permease
MPASSRRAYLAWVAVCLIWGTTYLGIRIALETIPPFLMSAARWIVAGSIIIAILKARGHALPPRRSWGELAVLGFLLLGVGNGAVVWAEQTVSSGLTAVLVSLSPFWMVGIEALMADGERLTARRVLGLFVGLAGVVVLVWPEIEIGSGFLGGLVSTQLACAGWALGSVYARRHHRDENVLATAAIEMLFGGLMLAAAALFRHEWTMVAFNPRTSGALAYLILVGAIGGFSAYAYALKHLPVATVSLYAYVNPVIAVILGTLVLGEPFSSRMALAAGIVLAGMALVRTRPPISPSGQSSDDASAADDPHQQQHDGDHEKHVDKAANRVTADKPKEP